MKPRMQPARPTSRPRMKNGWFGYVAWPKPQMNAAMTTAAPRERKTFWKNGIEKARDMNSSLSAGNQPAKSTATHGNAVFSIESYGTSAGDHAPNLSAIRDRKSVGEGK